MGIECDVRIKSVGKLGLFPTINQNVEEAKRVRTVAINQAVIKVFGRQHNFLDLDEKILKVSSLRNFTDFSGYLQDCTKIAEDKIYSTIHAACNQVFHVVCSDRTFYHEKYPQSEDIRQELFSQNKIQRFNTGKNPVEMVSLSRLWSFTKMSALNLIRDEIRREMARLPEVADGQYLLLNSEGLDVPDEQGFDITVKKAEFAERFHKLVNEQGEPLRTFIKLKMNEAPMQDIMHKLNLTTHKYYTTLKKMNKLFREDGGKF